ncbi:MAG: preprotein translocase subunit YajC [Flavobacteriales bacterium]|nr:preprotein translocase subunit YajC [Flavobacteriales bacterium]
MQELLGEGGSTIIMFILMFVVFYFFMIRPQSKKAKDDKKFRDELKQGDKVVTIGGIHGKVADVKESAVILEVSNNVKLRVEKSAISRDNSVGLQQSN